MTVVRQSVSYIRAILTRLKYSRWNLAKLPHLTVRHHSPDWKPGGSIQAGGRTYQKDEPANRFSQHFNRLIRMHFTPYRKSSGVPLYRKSVVV